jgi:uncharacterized protein (TIGR03118 family)
MSPGSLAALNAGDQHGAHDLNCRGRHPSNFSRRMSMKCRHRIRAAASCLRSFAPVTLPGHRFRDPHLPANYAPFGIQEINGEIYVTYGKQNADRTEEVTGAGNGFVSVFSPTGQFVRRFASNGVLNAPWGLSLAPASFGRFGNRLLVGNFGDGTINAFDVDSGRFVGTLHGKNRKPIRIDGLWGIAFGNGLANQPTNALFFAAGTNDEENGLYGRLDAIPDRHHYKAGDLDY